MYRARFIVAGSLMALIAAALCVLALLPSYLALRADGAGNSAPTTASKAATEADRAAIASLRAVLTSLSPLVAATTTPTAAIGKALSLRPATISIDHVTYTGGDSGTIMLVGSAATREAINGYRQALAADPYFKTVSIPVGDLAGAPGARFSLSLSGDF